MSSVKIKFIRDDGQQLSADFITWGIPSDGLKGIDFAEWNLYTEQLAFGDGSIITGGSYSSRNLTITLENMNTNYNQRDRNNVIRFFNPKHTFHIYVTYQGNTRWIEGSLNGFSVPSENIHRRLNVKIGFFCKDPFFKSVDEFSKDIASIQPGFGFPYIATDRFIPYVSVYMFNTEVELLNEGDIDVGIRVYMRFTGDVENPKIEQGGNKFQLIGKFKDNDVVKIDFDKQSVTKNGVNCYNLISSDSSFTKIKIPVGGTTISFNADEGHLNMSVIIYYNQLYGGL